MFGQAVGIACASIVTLSPSHAWGEAVVWETADGGNGHLYEAFVVSDGLSWTEALTLGTDQGGYLATLTTPEENQWVFDNVVNDTDLWRVGAVGYYVGPYIGLFQDNTALDYSEPAGGWRWITGEAFSYHNWADGQPNNVGAEDQNKGHFWTETAGVPGSTWQDIVNANPDSSPISYVVEYVPGPGSGGALLCAGVWGCRRRRRW